MAKLENVTNMDDDSLVNELAEVRQELFNLRFQHVTGQLDNTSRLSTLRRRIAQIHTELRTREIAAADALAAKESA